MNDNQEITLENIRSLNLDTVLESSALDNKKLLLCPGFSGEGEDLHISSFFEVAESCNGQYISFSTEDAVKMYNRIESHRKGDRRPLHADSLYGYIGSHHLDYKNGKRLILVTTISEDAGGPVSHFKVWKDKTLLYCGNDLTDALWTLRS